jgi:hypothetical protein
MVGSSINSEAKTLSLRCFFVCFLLILLSGNRKIIAQNKQAAIWHVGNKRLDFNTYPATITDVISPFWGTNSSLALADVNGGFQLFASTQTKKLYYNYLEIKNGDFDLATLAQQRIIFIPQPNNSNKTYCIFNEKYSLIDIQNDTVFEKNITWDNSNSSDIANLYAVHHANCNDIWLIAQHTDGFYSYQVSNTGISNQPVYTPSQNYVGHRGTFSSTGRYFAILNTVHDNIVHDTVLIDFGSFNKQTGILTKTYSYKFTNYQMCYGSAFSPDETKLYLFMQIRNSSTYHVYQVNVLNGIPDFNNAIIVNTQFIGGLSAYSSMQLGIDGKIYQTFYLSQKKINIIQNPNILGVGCNYQDNAISLSTSQNSLPIFIDTWFTNNYCILDFFAANTCFPELSQFTINNTVNIQSVLWNFGDSQTSTQLNPTHLYSNAGIYTVSLTVTFTNSTIQTVSKQIIISEKPVNLTIIHN